LDGPAKSLPAKFSLEMKLEPSGVKFAILSYRISLSDQNNGITAVTLISSNSGFTHEVSSVGWTK
jgi:hypothetical protein